MTHTLAERILPPDPRIYPLLAPETIRRQALRMVRWVQTGHGRFRIHEEALPAVADNVLSTIRASYPDLNMPFHSRWRHFSVGGIDRIATLLEPHLANLPAIARARVECDLAIVSVLLDAGAGARWQYTEHGGTPSATSYTRSQGLAVASLHMFLQGMFSSAPTTDPLRVDAAGLLALTPERLAAGMQHSSANPLLGFDGRCTLLHALGRAMQTQPHLFAARTDHRSSGKHEPHDTTGAHADLHTLRPGHLADLLLATTTDPIISAADILLAIQVGLGPIWPGRCRIAGFPLGDVWPYAAFGVGEDITATPDALIPFHKLSQWLTYSLVEPLERAGARVGDLHRLTGLAEYRNGGLLIDGGVLTLVDPADAERTHAAGSPLIVEWRALTVHFLDRIAALIRQRLNMDETSLPMVKVLEGGTWQAGRQWAELRRGGQPPLTLESDGTVF